MKIKSTEQSLDIFNPFNILHRSGKWSGISVPYRHKHYTVYTQWEKIIIFHEVSLVIKKSASNMSVM